MVIELKQSDYPGRWWTMLPDGRIEIHKAAFHRAGAAGTRARQTGSPNGRESGSERVKRLQCHADETELVPPASSDRRLRACPERKSCPERSRMGRMGQSPATISRIDGPQGRG